MAERKVLIRYYSPDFDPKKLEKLKIKKDKQDNVRMMLPMSVRCNTCGNFLYIGTKYNMRKETCQDISYLGIKVFRFYFKCNCCHSQITMRTDPQQHDYVCEYGATRNYEARRDEAHAATILEAQKQLDQAGDKMKEIETKQYDSKREMAVLDALEETMQLNKRLQKFDPDDILIKMQKDKENSVKPKSEKVDTSFMKFKRINENSTENPDNFDDEQMKQLLLSNFDEKEELVEIDDPFALFKDQVEQTQESIKSKGNQSSILGKRAHEEIEKPQNNIKNIILKNIKIQKIDPEVSQKQEKEKALDSHPLFDYGSSSSEENE